MIADMFRRLFELMWQAFEWLVRHAKSLVQKIIDVIVSFFRMIYFLIDGLLYFLYMVGVVAVKLFLLFFELGKLIISLFVGFGKTLSSLVYVQSSSSGNGYSNMIGKIMTAATNNLQLNVIAYVLLFIIWFLFVVSAIKLISSIRIGGD